MPSFTKKKFQIMLLLSPRNKKEFPHAFSLLSLLLELRGCLGVWTSTKYYTKSTDSIPMGHWIPVTEKRCPTLGDQRYLIHFQAFTPCLLLENNTNNRNHHSVHVHSVQDYYQLPKNSKFLSGAQHRRQHCVLLQQDAFKY